VPLPLIDSSYSQILAAVVIIAVACWTLLIFRRYVSINLATQGSLVDQVNRLLPQTQCGRCGFEGCRPYARAIVEGESINRCPPGGTDTIIHLANLMNERRQALDPGAGNYQLPTVAVIREAECIGCTLCIQACPLDAILGAAKLMHTVFEQECSGCDLCVEPCPVDCIDMVPISRDSHLPWQAPGEIRSVYNPLDSMS
jgi:electron transport complex protein RnfB|tara:strand:- start:2103 stop:2699 length:597 start_codon:yes stop_codon:yes gene_type:complete